MITRSNRLSGASAAAQESDNPNVRARAYAKWGNALDAGFQIVPDVLIRAQSKLGLETTDLAVLLNITMHWWDADNLPYPRPSVIAKRIGVSKRTVERSLERLQTANLISRLPAEKAKDGLSVRRFDLTGLVVRLKEFAVNNLASREQQERLQVTPDTKFAAPDL
jgi:Helix-turn-helix domain